MTPKVFKTLLVLVEHRSRVLTKDELLNAIWPEQAVEEANLTQNISVLRKALSEAAQGKKYIATFPGQGYKFLEPVSVGHLESEPVSLPASAIFEPIETVAASNVGLPPAKIWRDFVLTLLVLGLCAICILVLAFDRKRTIAKTQINRVTNTTEIRTLTRMFGAAYQPAWSRDGQHLAFVFSGSPESASAIYVQSAGDIQPHQLTSGDGEYSSPAWSPEGTRLAYIHSVDGTAEIVIADLVNSTSKTLARIFPRRYGLSCRRLAWSPNGRLLVVGDKSSDADPFSLYLVYIANGEKTRLTYPTMDIIGDVNPRFSPDGTRVAFIRMKYQYQYNVFTIPAIGGETRAVTNKPALIRDVDWETNERLVYSAKRGGEYRFWRVDLRLKKTAAKLASPFATDLPLQFAVSQRSKTIAFSTYHPNLNIWALNLPAASASHPVWTPVIGTPGEDTFPSFSPDGTKICFRSDRSGMARLWISKSDGSGAFPLTGAPAQPTFSSWSPDGKTVVSSVADRHSLYFESIANPLRAWKVSSNIFAHPSYSTDGKWIFVQAGFLIYRLPSAGGTPELLTDQGGFPVVESRDGRYIYFARGRTDSRIFRLELATKHQELMVDSLMPGYWDCWALTVHGIYFLSGKSGLPTIEFHDFATGTNRTIARFPGDLPPIGTAAFSISPDGRKLLVVRADPTTADIQSIALTP